MMDAAKAQEELNVAKEKVLRQELSDMAKSLNKAETALHKAETALDKAKSDKLDVEAKLDDAIEAARLLTEQNDLQRREHMIRQLFTPLPDLKVSLTDVDPNSEAHDFLWKFAKYSKRRQRDGIFGVQSIREWSVDMMHFCDTSADVDFKRIHNGNTTMDWYRAVSRCPDVDPDDEENKWLPQPEHGSVMRVSIPGFEKKNIYALFHGTTSEAVDLIITHGFDPNGGTPNGKMFGPGGYCSHDLGKIDLYGKPDATGKRHFLIMLCCLGRPQVEFRDKKQKPGPQWGYNSTVGATIEQSSPYGGNGVLDKPEFVVEARFCLPVYHGWYGHQCQPNDGCRHCAPTAGVLFP